MIRVIYNKGCRESGSPCFISYSDFRESAAELFSVGFDLIDCRHYAERALLGGDQGSCGICKCKKLMQLLLIHLKTIFQDMVQSGSAECVARACRLDSVRVKEACLVSFNAVAVCLGAVRAVCRKYERDLVLIDDHLDALVEVFLAGHEGDLVVGDLKDVALGQTVSDLLFCLLLGAPER